jgi:hypothetical protein
LKQLHVVPKTVHAILALLIVSGTATAILVALLLLFWAHVVRSAPLYFRLVRLSSAQWRGFAGLYRQSLAGIRVLHTLSLP